MQLEVLGACGGLGEGTLTTSFKLGDRCLLDGGTGVSSLSLEQMYQIDQVLITHGHLDHVAGISLMLATVIGYRENPIQIIAPADVLAVMKEHVFNWSLWPDFSVLPTEENPILEWVEVEPEKPFKLGDQLTAEAVLLSHTVPSYAYLITDGERAFCFCGDTAKTETLWSRLKSESQLKNLFIELSYPSERSEIARISGHHSVDSLFADLENLNQDVQINLMHHKPGYEARIREEVAQQGFADRFKLEYCDPGRRFSVL